MAVRFVFAFLVALLVAIAFAVLATALPEDRVQVGPRTDADVPVVRFGELFPCGVSAGAAEHAPQCGALGVATPSECGSEISGERRTA